MGREQMRWYDRLGLNRIGFTLWQSLLDLLFPPRCLVCGMERPEKLGICPACRQGMFRAEEVCCPRCGVPVRGGWGEGTLCPFADVCLAAWMG